MVEQRSPKPMVGGSNPSAPATFHLDEKNYMNAHQQQLLQQLRIQPYQLHADFVVSLAATQKSTSVTEISLVATEPDIQSVPRHLTPTAVETVTALSALPLESSDSAALQQLRQDILLLLQAELPMVNWQPSAQNTDCHWQGHILQTPEIQAFCSSAQKKQLWLEFIKAQEQVDGSPHSSSHPG